MRHFTFAVVVSAFFGSGCAAISTMQPASTMGKGNIQGGVEGGIALNVVTDPNLAAQLGQSLGGYPAVNGFLRFGVTDNVDIGFRAGETLLELETKFMFTDPSSSFVVSLAPSLSGFWVPATKGAASGAMAGVPSPEVGRLQLPVPLLLGIKFGDHELVFGARIVNDLLFLKPVVAPDTLVIGYQISLGAEAGFALRIGNGFILMPEIAIQAPVALTARSSLGGTGSYYGPGEVIFTAGVGCIFGRMKPRGAKAVKREEKEEEWEEEKVPPPSPPPTPVPSPLPPDVAPPPPPPPQP